MRNNCKQIRRMHVVSHVGLYTVSQETKHTLKDAELCSLVPHLVQLN